VLKELGFHGAPSRSPTPTTTSPRSAASVEAAAVRQQNFSNLVGADLHRKVTELAARPGPIDEAAYAELDREYTGR
jgi:hypothetical protein